MAKKKNSQKKEINKNLILGIVVVLLWIFIFSSGGITGNATFADSVEDPDERDTPSFEEASESFGFLRSIMGWLFDDAPAEADEEEDGCKLRGDNVPDYTFCLLEDGGQGICLDGVCSEDDEDRDDFEGPCNNDGRCDTRNYGENMFNCPGDCQTCSLGERYYKTELHNGVNSKKGDFNFAPNIPLNPPIELPDGTLVSVQGPNKGCTIDKPFCYKKDPWEYPKVGETDPQKIPVCVSCVPYDQRKAIDRGFDPELRAELVDIGCDFENPKCVVDDEDYSENHCGPRP